MSDHDIPLRIDAEPLAVRTRGIEKRYGRATALAGLDLTVPEGAFYLLVGPNGAGKSTTMRILLDTVRADAGVAEVFGLDTRRGAEVRAGIGWVPEGRDAHYGWMRVDRLIASHAAYYPSWDEDYAARLVNSLRVKTDRRFGRLSKGEARRVQLLLALAQRPRLLLLDEPTDGLDPAGRELVLGILAEHLVEAPAAVVASTHRVYEMDRLADHLGVLHDGGLVAQMRRDELDRRMRTYALEVPADWDGAAAGDLAPAGATPSGSAQGRSAQIGATAASPTLVRANGRQRERNWMIWGDEPAVVEWLAASGATVREVASVTLEDAAVALLAGRE